MQPIVAFQRIKIYALRGYDTPRADEKDLFLASILDVLRKVDGDRIEAEAYAADGKSNIFSLTDYRAKRRGPKR